MNRNRRRREFLGAAAAAALLGSHSTGQEMNDTGTTVQHEVRLEFLRPLEIKQAQVACPSGANSRVRLAEV